LRAARQCFALGIRTRGPWYRTLGQGSTVNVLSWPAFCARVAELRAGQLFRHNVAGDLPGKCELVDRARLAELVDAIAHSGARAWTYTHKRPELAENAAAILDANTRGLVVNLSADSLAEADELASLQLGPVTVTVPSWHPTVSRTPAGRLVRVCLAQSGNATCTDCGRGRPLCARADRPAIVAFRSHGQARKRLDARLAEELASVS
jgi:hypothetical protein